MNSIFTKETTFTPEKPTTYTPEVQATMVLARLRADLQSFNKLATESLARLVSASTKLKVTFADSPPEILFGYTNEQKLTLLGKEDATELLRRQELFNEGLTKLSEAVSYKE